MQSLHQSFNALFKGMTLAVCAATLGTLFARVKGFKFVTFDAKATFLAVFVFCAPERNDLATLLSMTDVMLGNERVAAGPQTSHVGLAAVLIPLA